MLIDEHDGPTDSDSDLCHILTSNESMLFPSQRLKLSPLSLVIVEQLFAGIANKLFSFVVSVLELATFAVALLLLLLLL